MYKVTRIYFCIHAYACLDFLLLKKEICFSPRKFNGYKKFLKKSTRPPQFYSKQMMKSRNIILIGHTTNGHETIQHQ